MANSTSTTVYLFGDEPLSLRGNVHGPGKPLGSVNVIDAEVNIVSDNPERLRELAVELADVADDLERAIALHLAQMKGVV